MNNTDMRNSTGYKEAIAKIEGYRKGFVCSRIPTAKANGLKFILRDAEEAGLINAPRKA